MAPLQENNQRAFQEFLVSDRKLQEVEVRSGQDTRTAGVAASVASSKETYSTNVTHGRGTGFDNIDKTVV
jgi:hypothetical protein